MITNVNQRWRERRASYRPAGEPIDTSRFEVGPLQADLAEARAFVGRHHYQRTWPAARESFGLYRSDQLVGVAVFGVPMQSKVITGCLPGDPLDHVELSRFVLLDEVPGNGESWFLARCFALLRLHGYRGVVSFSDPLPRSDSAGRVTTPGHVGCIYQAHNAVYLGQRARKTIYVLPDGRTFNGRTMSKLRGGEQGWRGAARQLQAYGAPELGRRPSDSARRAWATRWLGQLTTRVRHPGNHKYAWGLDRVTKRHLPQSLPYPKRHASLAA